MSNRYKARYKKRSQLQQNARIRRAKRLQQDEEMETPKNTVNKQLYIIFICCALFILGSFWVINMNKKEDIDVGMREDSKKYQVIPLKLRPRPEVKNH